VKWPSAEHARFAGNCKQQNVSIGIGFSHAMSHYSPTRLRDEPNK
jgi:hypothetical protein